jgi:hypothetical protein
MKFEPAVIRRLADEQRKITLTAGVAVADALEACLGEIEALREVLADKRRLTRELDIALNGDGAAKQASLCDVVAQVKDERWKLVRAD